MGGFLTESMSVEYAKGAMGSLAKRLKKRLRGIYIDPMIGRGQSRGIVVGEFAFAFDDEGEDGGLVTVEFTHRGSGAMSYRVKESDTSGWSNVLKNGDELLQEVIHLIGYIRKKNARHSKTNTRR